MFPRRGAIALVTTAMALVLLFNFKTPDQAPLTGGIASTGGSIPAPSSASGTARRAGPPRRAGRTDPPARRPDSRRRGPVDRHRDDRERDADRQRLLVALRQYPGPGHDHERQDHLGHRPAAADRRALGPDLAVRRADPVERGADGTERQHRHRVRGDVHERGLRPVPPVGARPGRRGDPAGRLRTRPSSGTVLPPCRPTTGATSSRGLDLRQAVVVRPSG